MSLPSSRSGSHKPPPTTLGKRQSIDSIDPLSTVSTRSGTPNAPRREDGAQPKPRFSVVLGASPHRPAFHEPDTQDDLAHDEEQPVMSDLSPQFKKKMGLVKQTPVPLPVLPSQTSKSTAQANTQKQAITIPLPQRPAVAAGTTAIKSGRGRPKGWKPGMSYATMRGNTPPGSRVARSRIERAGKPKPGELKVMKRRGRPSKQLSPPPRALYYMSNPQFVVFLCEWKGCKAELHNLETLRRHIDIIHLEKQKKQWHCHWGKCGSKKPAPEFSAPGALKAHMDEAHLIPFAWHVGDGPRNSSGQRSKKPHVTGEDEIPAYLKDAEGNQVTPSVRDQEVEDYMTWKQNRKKLKELLLERDRNLASEESDEPVDDDAGLLM